MDSCHLLPLGSDAAASDDSGQAEFECLYATEYEPMVRLAWMLLGNRAAAEDAVQESFVRVGRRFTAIDQPKAYLRTTVVNACRSEFRRLARWSSGDSAVAEPWTAPTCLAEFTDVLNALPYRQRAVLVLRYVTGLDDAQIGQIIGARRSTVRTLAQRGLQSLRGTLHDA